MISFEVVEDKKCERNFLTKLIKKKRSDSSSEKKERETKH
tara:strand:- start:249 stop:368 length:120 start_codon:yes stop_codon:yes gene_type:complete